MAPLYRQDLHIHTVYSTDDGAIVPEQTLDLIGAVSHAEVIGISDHFVYVRGQDFGSYADDVRSRGFMVGTEVDGGNEAADAAGYPVDYFISHCRDAHQPNWLNLNVSRLVAQELAVEESILFG